MTQSKHSDERHTVPPAHSAIGPRTLAMLWSCAGVCTGYVLGMQSLAEPALGLPLGAWLVGGSIALSHIAASRAAAGSASSRFPLRRSIANTVTFLQPCEDRLERLWDSGTDALGWGRIESLTQRAATLPLRAARSVRTLEHVSPLARLREGSVDGVKSLRIGVDLNDADASHLINAGAGTLNSSLRIQWVRTPAGAFNSAREDLRGLDALVRRKVDRPGDPGRTFAFVPEDRDRPAGWFDWSIVPPLSFASLFPTRLDPAQVELGGANLGDPDQARLAAAMVVAAAAMGRADCRVRDGRWVARPSIGNPTDPTGPIASAMNNLCAAFETVTVKFAAHHQPDCPPFMRAAARLVGAWASTSDLALNADRREKLLTLAAEGMETEPQQVLRVAAGQFAVGNEQAGIRSLLWARRRLRATAAECAVDPLAFVQSEIELGRPGGMSLGRVAAGLTLLWSTCPPERHAYLREDLLDDLGHAGWLMGREQDRELLTRIMDELDRAEHSDHATTLRHAA